MGDMNRAPGLPLWSDHVAFARRHGLLIGALMALGLAAGFVWSLQQPSSYSATASVALAPVPVYVVTTTDELVPPEVSVDTDAQLLRSGRVLDAIGEVLGIERDEAAERLSVTASANTHVLHVRVSADSPERAAAAANAAVDTLTGVRRRTLGALQEDQQRNLRMLVGNHGGQLDEVLAEEDAGLLLSTDEEQFAQVLGARASLDELEEARANPAEVVRPASPPQRPDYANTEVAVVTGAMLGLLAGCLLALGRDRSRPRGSVRSGPPSDRPVLHLQTIGTTHRTPPPHE